MFEEELQHLLESWKKAFRQYSNNKMEAEKEVVRWEWTNGERYNPLPYHFVRFPGRGRILKDSPKSIGNYFLYGFDEQNRVCLHEEYEYKRYLPANILQKMFRREDLSKELFSEHFYHYLPDRVEVFGFSAAPHTPIPLSIHQIFFEKGKVKFFGSFRVNGYSPVYSEKGADPEHFYKWLGPNGRFINAEAYIYEGKRLKAISGYSEVPGIGPHSWQEQFMYNEAGTLLSIDRVFNNGQKQAVYRKRKKGQTFQDIREEATNKLVEAITQRVRAANIQEKVYCIELSYNKFAEQFPPCIIVTPESYRSKILQSRNSRDRLCIFSPIFENEWFFTIEDPKTTELCEILEQEIRAGDRWDEATSILREVAAILTHQDWANVLDTTSDFVVFALDPELEGQDIIEILRSSVSEKQIQEWVDKGWLM